MRIRLLYCVRTWLYQIIAGLRINGGFSCFMAPLVPPSLFPSSSSEASGVKNPSRQGVTFPTEGEIAGGEGEGPTPLDVGATWNVLLWEGLLLQPSGSTGLLPVSQGANSNIPLFRCSLLFLPPLWP
jgi:hypothetical protein